MVIKFQVLKRLYYLYGNSIKELKGKSFEESQRTIIMKKCIILFFMTCVFANTFAQHIDFMGIPLGQPMKTFDRSLRAKGFTSDGESRVPNLHHYKGEFWRYEITYLIVEEENGRASRVVVAPLRSNISDLNSLVNSLTKKYGRYTTKNGDEYVWKLRGGEIRAEYYRGIGIYYTDRTSSIFYRKYQRNYEDDL